MAYTVAIHNLNTPSKLFTVAPGLFASNLITNAIYDWHVIVTDGLYQTIRPRWQYTAFVSECRAHPPMVLRPQFGPMARTKALSCEFFRR